MAPYSFIFLFLILNIALVNSVFATEFVYNKDFNSTNIVLHGNATIQHSILTLTNQTFFSIGQAFYPHKIPMLPTNSSTPLPFAASFIFSIAPCKGFPTAHGFAFVFSPVKDIAGALSANYLGLFNRSDMGNSSNHVFAIEFDDFKNEDFDDVDDNHVGVDLNTLISLYSEPAGFWGGRDGEELEELKLDDGHNYQAWIEFLDSKLNVTVAPAGKRKPQRPLISRNVNLSGILLDEMYVGFSGATGVMVDICRILAWSFSNSNFSIGDALKTKTWPLYVHAKGWKLRSKGFMVGVIFGALFITGCGIVMFFGLLRTIRRKRDENTEDWELEYWPHRISYQEIFAATRGFSEENVIGIGTSGKVYKGVLNGEEVAVKRIHHDSHHRMRDFLAEISSLGRMKHRNLVPLRGWCKRKRGYLILVYHYMENGSLDKRIFACEDSKLLSWEERISVLLDVAYGVLYLHEGWEVEVLHRDIKAANVLLDKDMNARLGDFGLARLQHKENLPETTRIIGTKGYIAPEVVRTGRPSTASDVYSFGVLVLEVVCGRRPTVEDKPPLVEYVLSLMESGKLYCALDERLKGQSECTIGIEEAERVLHLGLLCASSDPCVRPTMRHVVEVLQGIKGKECGGKECIHVSLLEQIKSSAMWSWSGANSPHGSYPTFEEIMQSKMRPTSLTGSYPVSQSESILLEGR